MLIERTLYNPTLWAVAETAALTAYSLTDPSRQSLLTYMIGVTTLIITVMTFRKELLYESSLLLTILSGWLFNYNWWDKIEDNLYLGALPLEKHTNQLKDFSVLSVVEPFELKHQGLFTTPATLNRKVLPTPDFLPLTPEKIQEGITFIQDEIKSGKKVYVHCKAGVGRGPTIILAYLISQGKNLNQAYQEIKSKRKQVRLNRSQLQAVINWHSGSQVDPACVFESHLEQLSNLV